MNIELDEVVVQDVSDDALELAAGGAQGGQVWRTNNPLFCARPLLAYCAPGAIGLGVGLV
jgi:hypothetical protein